MTAAPTPEEIEELRKFAQAVADAGAAWRAEQSPAHWEAFSTAQADFMAYVEADDVLGLLARLAAAEEPLVELQQAVIDGDEDAQCRIVGHKVIDDHCGKPKHRYCARCGMLESELRAAGGGK